MSKRQHKPHLELVSVEGSPTEPEQQAIQAALEDMIETEREIVAAPIWKRAARGQGRRLGMLDYRDRFSNEDAWRLSTRFPFGGREYPGRSGRGDTK
jgi:hypothetical protein